ncbi:conserved exported hypothetical protein [Tenacibaculum sp. 190524A05c]|uniref:DUF6660 family protein n=1 Tax=Tenacibaculum platacis TaxID=3137852 RepID=UPI0031FAAC60
MKSIAIILSLLFLVLSVKPCSDGTNSEDLYQSEIGSNHNHQEDSNDSCPVTCACDCCGMSITYESLRVHNLINYNNISTKLISTYQPIYRFSFLSSIWQPPQVIS